MKSLLAPTEDFIKVERTELTADASAGSSVALTVKNNNGMANNTFVVVGREGAEGAELCKINASVTAGTAIQVATLVLAHKKGEPVTVYRYDKRKFYGCATSDGTFVELTSDGSPVAIQVDDPTGAQLEYSGSTYTYFKATYYNSVTAAETSIEEARSVLADESARYATIYGIRKKGGFANNSYLSDGRIEDKRMQAENEINSTLITRYSLPLDEVPPLITLVCELLAAGYLHYEEFGSEGDGVKMLGEARGILKKIQSGEQRLIGADWTELAAITTINVLRGKPDGSEEGDEVAKFTIADKY